MLKPLADRTHLLPGEAMDADNLLFSHCFEAGLKSCAGRPEGIHWGWDSPTSEIRGTVVGHWLSAAAHIFAETGDKEADWFTEFTDEIDRDPLKIVHVFVES